MYSVIVLGPVIVPVIVPRLAVSYYFKSESETFYDEFKQSVMP